MKRVLHKIAHHYKDIPNKKPYIEFITAILSIPVLLTVIVLNLNSLRTDKTTKVTPTNTTTTEKIYVTTPAGQVQEINPTQAPCTPGIGAVEISSPSENEMVTDNPVVVDINYQKGIYCEVVWSFRVNNGSWSDYTNNSISLSNLPQGNTKFDLRIKSIVNSDTDSVTRNFVYRGTSIVPTSPVSSTSAN